MRSGSRSGSTPSSPPTTRGAAKPAAGIFDLAAERLPATEHTMVGDDPEVDVAGARNAGWRAIHLDGDGIGADLVGLL